MANYKKGQTRVPDSAISSIDFKYSRIDDIKEVEIGKRLRMVRHAYGETLDEMCEKLQLSNGGLRKLETGVTCPGGKTLMLLHEVYGVDITWLLYGIHTTYQDILCALSGQDDRVKFDVFVRLFSYFAAGDYMALVPSFGRCAGVEHFAKWNETFYRPLEPSDTENADAASFEHGNTFDKTDLLSQIESLSDKDKADLLEQIESLSDDEQIAFWDILEKTMAKKRKK